MILIRTVCSMGMKCQTVGECYVKDGKVRYFSWREGAEYRVVPLVTFPLVLRIRQQEYNQ